MIVDKLVWTGHGYVNQKVSINLTIPSYVNYIVIKGLSNDIKIVKGCTTEILYSNNQGTSTSTVSYNSNNTLKISSGDRQVGTNLWFEGYQYL